ncbi:MAG: radical SAM protein [Betaproteobacteria bacterium]
MTEAARQQQRLAAIRARLQRTGQWHAGQVAGRRYPIGCVSLEITQRCNLDCTACYLADDAESMRDPPLEDLLRRIADLRERYGPDTDVQISGGEPTLRKRRELRAVVAAVAAAGMRSSLFTNGLLVTRELLADLAAAGLTDVAFHVDMTQQHRGYASEAELNALRERMISSARGLPVQVMFNTTINAANLHELPDLVRFFARHADVARFVAFQIQADTGRGDLGARGTTVDQASVIAAIQAGAGVPLDFDVLTAGHRACNRFAMAWVLGDRMRDALAERATVQRLVAASAEIRIERRSSLAGVRSALAGLARHPELWAPALGWAARSAWRIKGDLLRARGRVRKLSILIHNFMDARQLDRERLDACVFMAATPQGPLPMCEFNARRAEILEQPIALADGSFWSPRRAAHNVVEFPLRFVKGRTRTAGRAGQAA